MNIFISGYGNFYRTILRWIETNIDVEKDKQSNSFHSLGPIYQKGPSESQIPLAID
jgi:hypothetical protein